MLVPCKAGVVHLWSPSTPAFGWSGYRALFLQTQKLSVGSSALHPVSGMHYIRSQDALLLCLCDGSLHVIHDISREPTWSSATASPVTTESLSLMARTVFVRAEPEEMQYADANRISGMLSYDGSATVLWLHEFVVFISTCHTQSLSPSFEGPAVHLILVTSTKPSTIVCL